MGIAHFDDAPSGEIDIGHLKGRWTFLGQAAGSVRVGLRRIEIPAGAWSTPAHEHGSEEEIFFILSGRGHSWERQKTAPIRAGDCILYLAGHGAHTLHAQEDLDVLAFGPRHRVESVGFPRLEMSLIGRRAVASAEGAVDGMPLQFVREAEIGPPPLPEQPGERPPTIVNLEEVAVMSWDRPRIASNRRDLGDATGSVTTGLGHVEVPPGQQATPLHSHSQEEELFVVLDGDGVLLLDDEETPVWRGSVIARPAATGVAHALRAGERGLTYLAYGTREPGDMCYYPRSNKISFRGLGVIGRIERLDYWDGED